jgi:hypothetical protein
VADGNWRAHFAVMIVQENFWVTNASPLMRAHTMMHLEQSRGLGFAPGRVCVHVYCARLAGALAH